MSIFSPLKLSPNQENILSLPPPTYKPAVANAIKRSLRYPALMGQDWNVLPKPIQHRFIKHSPSRTATLFQGRIHHTKISKIGKAFSFACKMLGGLLPITSQNKGAAIVIVREAKKFNGQYWTRIYPGKSENPITMQTIKRFDGPTGLEEIVSKYLGIALTVNTANNSLTFTSDHYFMLLGKYRLKIPKIFTPGTIIVSHKETGPRRFRYTISLTHPLLGQLIYQTAIFEEIS